MNWAIILVRIASRYELLIHFQNKMDDLNYSNNFHMKI
jgi:hypothetical protein